MELSTYLQIFTRATFLFLALCLLGWLFLAEYRPHLAGLMLGSSVSAWNMRFLGLKIQRLSEMVTQSKSKRFSLGFVSRLCMVLIAVMFAVRFEAIHLPATITGLFYGPVSIYVLGLTVLLRRRN